MDNHALTTQPDSTLARLNQIISEWCAQFDTPPALRASFSLTADGRLLFNDCPLGVCPSEIMEPTIYKDVQWFGFSTVYGSDFDFKICWPFGKGTTPSVEYVRCSIPKE